MLENLVVLFNPDIVVVMFFANDLEENHNDKEGRRPWFELVNGELVARNQPVTGEVANWWRIANRHSVALSTVRDAGHMLQERLERESAGR